MNKINYIELGNGCSYFHSKYFIINLFKNFNKNNYNYSYTYIIEYDDKDINKRKDQVANDSSWKIDYLNIFELFKLNILDTTVEDTSYICEFRKDEFFIKTISYKFKIIEKEYTEIIKKVCDKFVRSISDSNYTYDKIEYIVKDFLEKIYIEKWKVKVGLESIKEIGISKYFIEEIMIVLLIKWIITFDTLYGLVDIKLNYSTKGIFLNTNNWDVTMDWNIIWNLTLGNLPYKFFKYLFDNKTDRKSHKNIIENINPGKKEKTASSIASDIKRELPKEIKDIIVTTKWYYMIP